MILLSAMRRLYTLDVLPCSPGSGSRPIAVRHLNPPIARHYCTDFTIRHRSVPGSAWQVPAEEPQPVAVKHVVDRIGGIAATCQNRVEFLQVAYAIEPGGGLLGAIAAVQVAADGRVVGVAGELADVVDVVGYGIETDDRARGLAPIQPGASIQASRAAPMTAPRSISCLICSSLNCR